MSVGTECCLVWRSPEFCKSHAEARNPTVHLFTVGTPAAGRQVCSQALGEAGFVSYTNSNTPIESGNKEIPQTGRAVWGRRKTAAAVTKSGLSPSLF